MKVFKSESHRMKYEYEKKRLDFRKLFYEFTKQILIKKNKNDNKKP